jgi:6-phosphofructokinase 1
MKLDDFKIEHLGTPKIESPVRHSIFIDKSARTVYHSEVHELKKDYEDASMVLSFEKAGPRKNIYHDPPWSKAAILTAGGLCPGLNDVIKGLTYTLKAHYKVPIVYGLRYGYQGLIPDFGHEPLILDEETVDDIHEYGGTILGSSRGRQDEERMVDTLVRMNINVLFCIGGDGTLRCAHDVCKVIKKRKLSISVIGIPKTIDNDVGYIDKSFGFETAVYATNSVITAAHNEAKGAKNGVGLIKVMGRDSGFIAAYASLANSHVNYCLIPEEKFTLGDGSPNDLFADLKTRLTNRRHAVLMVAEGAGQEFFEGDLAKTDASGNKLHNDIGPYLKSRFKELAAEAGIEISVKYFDPSYQIRSLPAHGTDAVFCLLLAQNAVHAAMSGCTDMVVGHWNSQFTHVPIALATRERKKIDVNSDLWNSVKAVTWPSFKK